MNSAIQLGTLEQRLSQLEIRDDILSSSQKMDDVLTMLRLGEATAIAEHQNTRDVVAQEHQATRSDLKSHINEKSLREALLNSVFFPEWRERKEHVSSAEKDTFQWIFEAQEDEEARPSASRRRARWSHLAEWFRSGRDLYWIHGKAGSGKSTLCSYIVDEPRTQALIGRWSAGLEKYRLSFFFWTLGTSLQKNIAGVLHSLLYQLATSSGTLADAIIRNAGFSDHRIGAWSEHRLVQVFSETITSAPCRFFILVDGLDEFEGDLKVLIGLCNELRSLDNVKLCVSSR